MHCLAMGVNTAQQTSETPMMLSLAIGIQTKLSGSGVSIRPHSRTVHMHFEVPDIIVMLALACIGSCLSSPFAKWLKTANPLQAPSRPPPPPSPHASALPDVVFTQQDGLSLQGSQAESQQLQAGGRLNALKIHLSIPHRGSC